MKTTERLACGRPFGDLVEVVAEPGARPDAHQSGCPYCQDALSILRARWSAVRVEAADPPRPPAELVNRLLDGLRGQLRPAAAYLRLPSSGGALLLAEAVIGDVACRLAEDVPGVKVVGGSVAGAGNVDVDLVMAYGASAPRLAAQVRRRIRRGVRDLLGVDLQAVTVRFLDVVLDDTGV